MSNDLTFVIIPGFSKYRINKHGTLIVVKTHQEKVWSITKGNEETGRRGGYKYCQCVDDNGNTRMLYQHRVLAELFIPIPGNSKGLTVNHKDGNKSNNALDNLEWCTYGENNQHAWDTGLRIQETKKVLVKSLVTGEITKFKSKRECARHFGDEAAHYFTTRTKTIGDGKLWPDLLEFKMNDDTPWPNTKIKDVDLIPKVHNGLVARNVFTGALVTFSHAKQGEEALGVPSRVILDHARNNKVLPYNGYNFRYLAFSKSFPNFTEKHIRCFKDQEGLPPSSLGGGVDCIDTVTGETMFFPAIDICCEKLGIHKDHLQTLFNNKRLFQKRYQLTLFDIRKNLGPPTEQSVVNKVT